MARIISVASALTVLLFSGCFRVSTDLTPVAIDNIMGSG